MSIAKWKKYSKEEIQKMVEESFSNAELMRRMGYDGTGGNSTKVIQSIKEKYHEIDFSHFTGQVWNKGLTKEVDERVKNNGIKTRSLSYEEVFCENSKAQTKAVRIRLIGDGLIEEKCNFCGMDGTWLDTKITLEVDHINGISNDNRLENLRLLCPNCHATTSTYKGKNIKR